MRGYDSSRLGSLIEGNAHQDAVRDLLQKKQALLMELRNYESNTRSSMSTARTNMNAGMIPVSTTHLITEILNISIDSLFFLLFHFFKGQNKFTNNSLN